MELLTKTQPGMIVPTAIRLRNTKRAGLSFFFGTSLEELMLRARPMIVTAITRRDGCNWVGGRTTGMVTFFSKVLGILHIGSCDAPAHLLLRSCRVRLVGKWPNHDHHVAGREAAELRGEIVERAHSTTVGGTAGPPDTRFDQRRGAIPLAYIDRPENDPPSSPAPALGFVGGLGQRAFRRDRFVGGARTEVAARQIGQYRGLQ